MSHMKDTQSLPREQYYCRNVPKEATMNLYAARLNLNAEQSRAVERFRDHHRARKAQADSKLENERAFE